jgi:hypothetical protein
MLMRIVLENPSAQDDVKFDLKTKDMTIIETDHKNVTLIEYENKDGSYENKMLIKDVGWFTLSSDDFSQTLKDLSSINYTENDQAYERHEKNKSNRF